MSETTTPTSETLADAAPEALPPPAKPRGSVWPLLGVIGFLLLAAGEGYLFRLHQKGADEAGQIAALQRQLASLQQAPAAASPVTTGDLGPKLAALGAQVSALQTLFTADHGALITLQANAVDMTKLTSQINTLAAQDNTDHLALTALQASAVNLTKLTTQVTVLSRVQAARMALDAGQPLGDIPAAPAALQKFSATPPPTQAALLLSFPAAARAAESASVTADGKRSYWSNVLARLENLITVSNGTHVIIGAPAAGVIEQARADLDAGDLAGAVAVLDTLSLTTQQAMGSWLGQARDLLAARAAIATMAAE
jgi:hypothetical protein